MPESAGQMLLDPAALLIIAANIIVVVWLVGGDSINYKAFVGLRPSQIYTSVADNTVVHTASTLEVFA